MHVYLHSWWFRHHLFYLKVNSIDQASVTACTYWSFFQGFFPKDYNQINALCVRLNRIWELGIFTKMSTWPLIFLKLNYFRHNYLEIVLCSVSLLMHIWVQVEHGLLYRQVYTWISCNSSRLHAGCVWTYGDELNGALKKLIFDDLVSEIFGKYLHILDSIFTMFLAPEKKVILGCFFISR